MSDIWEQLKLRLEFFERPYPADAVELAHAHREEVAPHLIAVIEAVAENPEVARDGDYMLHMFAMHLLACWRDARAYRPLVRWGHLPQSVLDDILGDVLHESYGRCLASVCDGDLAPIKTLVEDRTASDWARDAALGALLVRVFENDLTRDSLIAYLQRRGAEEVARAHLSGVSDELDILNIIVAVASDLGAVNMLESIRQWFADGLLDETYADLPWVEKDITRSFDEHQSEELSRNNGYVRDVAKEIAWFASYREDADESDDEDIPWYDDAPNEPYVRPFDKIGRNDPCPCGSGKKFKKCHGA